MTDSFLCIPTNFTEKAMQLNLTFLCCIHRKFTEFDEYTNISLVVKYWHKGLYYSFFLYITSKSLVGALLKLFSLFIN